MIIIPNGIKISFIRIRAGLSMRGLAEKAGLTIGTISNVESKSKPVSPKTANSICNALNADFDQIFTIQ